MLPAPAAAVTETDFKTPEGKLHDYIKQGQHFTKQDPLDLVKKVLNASKTAVNAYYEGQTALHTAVVNAYSWPELIQYLLNRPEIDANRSSQAGDTPLHLAAAQDYGWVSHDGNQLWLLLNSSKVNVNAKNRQGDTALSIALKKRKSTRHFYETYAINAILCRHDLDLNPDETHRLLCICMDSEKNARVLNVLLSDPRIHQVFSSFSAKQIETLWLELQRAPSDEVKKMMACRILMHLFKKDSSLTIQDANAILPKFLKLKDAESYFKIAEKAATIPDHLILCFGFESVLSSDSLTLHDAISHCYLEAHRQPFLRLLQSGEYDVNAIEPRIAERNTVLHSAVRRHPLLVELLLAQENTDPTLTDSYGNTPLHRAMYQNKGKIVQLLLKHPKITGKIINAKNNEGMTPLQIGLRQGQIQSCKVLLADNRLTDFTSADHHGCTPLHYIAVRDRYLEILPSFLKKDLTKDDFNKKNKEGYTPFFYTDIYAFMQHVAERFLFDERMDVTSTGPKGETTLKWAIQKRNVKAVRFLVEKLDMKKQDHASLLLKFAIDMDDVKLFQFLLARMNPTQAQPLPIPHPIHDPRGFAAHAWMQNSRKIVVYYGFLHVLKTNQDLLFFQVYHVLQNQNFPNCGNWSFEEMEQAYQSAQQTLTGPADLFALNVFLSDEDRLLQLKNADELSYVEKVIEAPGRRFFTMMKQLPMDLQMRICHLAMGIDKQHILSTDSEPAFHRLAKTLLDVEAKAQSGAESLDNPESQAGVGEEAAIAIVPPEQVLFPIAPISVPPVLSETQDPVKPTEHIQTPAKKMLVPFETLRSVIATIQKQRTHNPITTWLSKFFGLNLRQEKSKLTEKFIGFLNKEKDNLSAQDFLKYAGRFKVAQQVLERSRFKKGSKGAAALIQDLIMANTDNETALLSQFQSHQKPLDIRKQYGIRKEERRYEEIKGMIGKKDLKL